MLPDRSNPVSITMEEPVEDEAEASTAEELVSIRLLLTILTTKGGAKIGAFNMWKDMNQHKANDREGMIMNIQIYRRKTGLNVYSFARGSVRMCFFSYDGEGMTLVELVRLGMRSCYWLELG